MHSKTLKIFSLLLVLCLLLGAIPALPATADALTVGIDSINGSKTVSGSYIWTAGTFDATYWLAVEASYVSYNVYKVKTIYPSGAKSVAVSGNNILLVVHTSHDEYVNAAKIIVGDVLTLYNIDLGAGTSSGGYVRVASGNGLTVSQGSGLAIDYGTKTISGIGVGTTAGVLKTHFTEATNILIVKDATGKTVADTVAVGTDYTIQGSTGGTYKLKVYGDIDGDSVITTTDYTLLHTLLRSGSTAYDAGGDANGDKAVSTADAVTLKVALKGSVGILTPALTAISKTEPPAVVVPKSTLNARSVTYKLSDVTGTHSGTTISGGNLTLASGSTSGSFTTGTINVGAFKTMLASWNAITNGGKVSMAVSFQVTTGNWSSYFSWGTWSSSSNVSTSSDSSDTYGSMSIDTLSVKSGYSANGNIKVKLTLTKYNGGTPTVQNFSIATPQMTSKVSVNTSALPASYLNNVPMRSQLASENGSIGNIICSPTTTAMALEYLGTKVTSLTAARAMYDINFGAYGNWSFATAYAGEKGYVAYLDLYDTDMLKYALSKGCVVGCSTMLTSSGHLVLVVGYTVINGVEYFIVNDPNVSESNIQRTNYTVSYFESKFLKSSMNNLGVVYVFQGDYDLNS